MLSHFSVIPPLSESAQEVPYYVCPASEFHQIVIERRMVLCQKHLFDLAARQASAAVLGAQSASQKLREGSNADRRSATNFVALPGLQS
jgi:hypothetical protein